MGAINWRCHPPTVMSFVRMVLDLVPDNLLSSKEKYILLELTKEQILAIGNGYEFAISYKPSYVAFACLLNSIESCKGGIEYDAFLGYLNRIGKLLQIDDYVCICNLQNKIYKQFNTIIDDECNDDDNHNANCSTSTSTKRPNKSSYEDTITTSNTNQSRSPTSVRGTPIAHHF